ncbi:MAG: Gfo/Idh/MocA family oxidoreductase [Ilumatobacter sp.]|uniref:Gfo/Idh/MocA family oxidoreductase n=1 Tax=Ilumatobacter sp. TaxID=1967498 RepID=UPI00261F0798|nr:Gfo/Idh/MocA family oxidoreductase [Ilumatobacter sp.]MDJ0767342.1 Gfo/Idh/MocA family oxidoreductase [Ilumatobacter sp.]
MTVRIAVAGAGAFGNKHLDGLAAIDDAEVVAIADPVAANAQKVAEARGIPHVATELDAVLARDDVDAVILATPTPVHASQAIACLEAGKHVEVEIPLCDNLADGRAVVAAQEASGLVAMCGHTRRFNPSHEWVRRRIESGEYTIQHMDVQTFFFRRTNTNALGEPRSWTDHLLWHHAAHTVDLFQYQTGSPVVAAQAMQGPVHPELGIAMDMSIQLRTEAGQLCTLALSFNNEGPFGTFFRYIGDTGTYVARYDDLVDGKEQPIDVSDVDVSMNGIELQDREFVAAITEGREPNASVAKVLPCYEVLDRIERHLQAQP